MHAYITANEFNLFMGLRTLDDTAKKTMRKQLFAAIKLRLGIPANHALKVDLDNVHSSAYKKVLRKKGNAPYDLHADGKWVGWTGRPVATPAAAPVATPVVNAATASTVYPTYVQGQAPRRFFLIDNDGVQNVIDNNSFDDGVDVLHGVVTDKQVDYQDGRGLRRTIILSNARSYAEFKAEEL
jgi:hypothetical protein